MGVLNRSTFGGRGLQSASIVIVIYCIWNTCIGLYANIDNVAALADHWIKWFLLVCHFFGVHFQSVALNPGNPFLALITQFLRIQDNSTKRLQKHLIFHATDYRDIYNPIILHK